MPGACWLAPVDHHDHRLCLDAVEEAIAKHGTLAVFNTDQGRQFTSKAFTGLLKRHGMNGKGFWRGNVLVEWLWRLITYIGVCLRDYEWVSQVRIEIGRYVPLANNGQLHSRLEGEAPSMVYFKSLHLPRAA
ncbi:DDE-type integrase/transposase/recombinase [Aquipseudomonas alcaligenes]|uniref:DDE-type integrase/transposase/recombinase n=1 Tax=Aquipseudomonas alcaligenes TaxID=43263 RepID=UPI00374378F6